MTGGYHGIFADQHFGGSFANPLVDSDGLVVADSRIFRHGNDGVYLKESNDFSVFSGNSVYDNAPMASIWKAMDIRFETTRRMAI